MDNEQHLATQQRLFERLESLNANNAIPSDIQGLYFGIYETEEGSYVYLSGAEEYDENDDDWACQHDFYAENFDFLIPFSDKTHWEMNQTLIQNLLLKYTKLADFKHTIFTKIPYIAMGYDDGDLIVIQSKRHEFLKLNMGCVEQCAMVVKKEKLAKWQAKGWLTYQQVNLPKGDEKAELLYGTIGKKSTLIFGKPPTLSQIDLQSLIGLRVKDFSTHQVTYGIGGAGCFGLLLDNQQYLTYGVWSSANYVTIDNRPVEPNNTPIRAWTSYFGGEDTWDELTPYLKNAVIQAIDLKEDTCKITLQKDEKTIELMLYQSFGLNDENQSKLAFENGIISDYLLLHPKKSTLIV